MIYLVKLHIDGVVDSVTVWVYSTSRQEQERHMAKAGQPPRPTLPKKVTHEDTPDRAQTPGTLETWETRTLGNLQLALHNPFSVNSFYSFGFFPWSYFLHQLVEWNRPYWKRQVIAYGFDDGIG